MAASAAATSVPGVKSADDDIMNQTLTVIYDDDKTSLERIADGMNREGFPVDGAPEVLP